MARLACVDLPAFPLQLLARAHPEWAGRPAVVVAEDAPQAPCVWVNAQARRAGILPGTRYAAALAIDPGLRAGVVRDAQVAAGVAEVVRRLRRFTPEIEPCDDEPGVFWANAGGLDRLHPSLERWAGLVRRGLARAGFETAVAVGFTRFGTYALARAVAGGAGVQVWRSAAAEWAAARRVPLGRLAIEPEARDTLGKLGVRTVGGLVHLPAEGLRRRFGPGVRRLHRLASQQAASEGEAPLQPLPPPDPLRARLEFDWPEAGLLRCLREWRRLLEPLLARAAARGGAAAAVTVDCVFDHAPRRSVRVRPAEPTLDVVQLLHLLELRFERDPFTDGMVESVLTVEPDRATAEQLRLFAERAGRDRQAAARALALVRAELGDDAVVHAELRDGHLPEATFGWEPCTQVAAPDLPEIPPDSRPLVRRIFERPRPLPPPSPTGTWRLAGGEPVVRKLGPYVVEGGWWATPIHREYHYAETRQGEIWWVYWDVKRQRWYLQGQVE